jgi:pimeloyl-ACP methyl ester carboxylesterase
MVSRRRRIWRRVRIVWMTLGAVSPFVLWWGMNSSGVPEGTLVSSETVEIVRAQDTIDFRPRPDDPSRAGLMFFPGALVDPEAYAPMARRIAEAGHRVVIVRLPFRMAPTPGYQEMVFQTVRQTMAASPRAWAVGGHSRGGLLATQFAAAHPGGFTGLGLVATTHPRELNLSSIPASVPVYKIFGTRDRVATPEDMRRYAGNLPAHTVFVEVAGGNHRQFGYYRYQLMDGRARINRVEQQRKMVEALLSMLGRIPAQP